jgi:hypothetical protein
MPEYYSKEEIINMFINSEEVINSHDIKLLEVRQKLYTISIYTNYQNHFIKYNNMHKYYYYQLMVLKFTKLIECIIYPNSGFKIKSIITNNLVTTSEEQILINNKIEELNFEFKFKKMQKSANKHTKKLVLAQMQKILPIDIIEHVAQYLANKRPSRKKSVTNWQNFCKHRKNAGFNYKDNSIVWKSLDYDIKNKYKNPYYKHF